MGNLGLTRDHMSIEKYTFPHYWKDNYPSDRVDSPYDPLEGFERGRKQRVMIATEEEMNSAKVPAQYRDYCAHKYIAYHACLKNNRPFYWRCRHERHDYGECEFEDSVLRMKEWERERRMKEREKKLKRMELAQ